MAVLGVTGNRINTQPPLTFVAAYPYVFSPLGFVFAAGLLFQNLTRGLKVGVVVSASALAGHAWFELYSFRESNSWIALNASERYLGVDLAAVKLRIFLIVVVLLALSYSALKLAPPSWSFRGVRLADRVWPAIAMTSIVVVIWFCWAVVPYRIPGTIDLADYPDIRILHIRKHGLRFSETTVSLSLHDGRIEIRRNHRRLLQYQFYDYSQRLVANGSIAKDGAGLIDLPQFTRASSVPLKPLRAWNAEGWYVVLPSRGPYAYTSQNQTQPPSEVVDLFNEIDALPSTIAYPQEQRDVCLGFCYDPSAGLGFQYVNQRCYRDPKNGAMRCS